ncbi:MAG: SHOCT domain-containing protein [Candidatus Lernaella stagnicola]|nr:SHOCT domain-containing protein [Candidatus Lernaella stagnicola]
MRRILIPILLIVLVFSLAACATKIRRTEVYKHRSDYVRLAYFEHKGEIQKLGYDHPREMTVEQVDAVLAAVVLEEKTLFKWTNSGGVFSAEHRQNLAPHLAKALAEANPDQWVEFAATGHQAYLSIFKKLVLIDGVCWIEGNKLHLVLRNVDYEVINRDQEPRRGDPREHFLFNARRLRVNPEAGFDKPPVVPGDKRLDEARRNWLVFDLARFFEPQTGDTVIKERLPEVKQGPAGEEIRPDKPKIRPDDTKTAAERLAELKELYEKGLITEEEYNRKRNEILEEL